MQGSEIHPLDGHANVAHAIVLSVQTSVHPVGQSVFCVLIITVPVLIPVPGSTFSQIVHLVSIQDRNDLFFELQFLFHGSKVLG